MKPSNPINMSIVTGMYNNYHEKVIDNPELYTNKRDGNRAIVVPMPPEFIDYCNRGAGSSGGRPVGIRRTTNDAIALRESVFESVDSLKQFILDSECDAFDVAPAERKRKRTINNVQSVQIISVDPLDRPISEFNLEQLYGKGTIAHLRNTYPKTALTEFHILTRREYEARYELTAVTELA